MEYLKLSWCSIYRKSEWEFAVEQLYVNIVCRTVCSNLDCSLNITMTEPLLLNPKPMTCHKLCRLAIAKRLAVIKCGSLVVGQSHGDCLGLVCGQRCALVRARATNEKECEDNNA